MQIIVQLANITPIIHYFMPFALIGTIYEELQQNETGVAPSCPREVWQLSKEIVKHLTKDIEYYGHYVSRHYPAVAETVSEQVVSSKSYDHYLYEG